MEEWQEALMRVPIIIVTGIILGVWKALVQVLIIVNFAYTLFADKRHKGIAEFCEIWNTQVYVFLRYIAFVTNERPFPFEKLTKNYTKFK